AVFHYGRWIFDASHGWVWVPGKEWAPAWVSWRDGSGYIGWAPLPPAIAWDGWRLSLGRFAIDNYIPLFWYCFVSESVFFAERAKEHIVLSARNETLPKLTKNATSYTAIECHVINWGVDIDRVERDIGQAISRYIIVDVESRQAMCQPMKEHGEIAFYRPAVLL